MGTHGDAFGTHGGRRGRRMGPRSDHRQIDVRHSRGVVSACARPRPPGLELFVCQLSIAFRRFCYPIDLIGADGGKPPIRPRNIEMIDEFLPTIRRFVARFVALELRRQHQSRKWKSVSRKVREPTAWPLREFPTTCRVTLNAAASHCTTAPTPRQRRPSTQIEMPRRPSRRSARSASTRQGIEHDPASLNAKRIHVGDLLMLWRLLPKTSRMV